MPFLRHHLTLALLPTLLLGCAGALESSGHARLSEYEREQPLAPVPEKLPEFDGSLGQYMAFALEHSPEARAAFERWRAATRGISRTRRLPEPTLSFGYFVRRVETRVGPQRFKVGISQMLPWPTKFSAASDSASEMASAAEKELGAELLRVKREVAAAYWTLWFISEEHRLKSEHDTVLESLAGAVRGRLQTGAATLADLSQIELNIARHHDHRGAHAEAARKASARLLSALGVANSGVVLQAGDVPRAGVPIVADAELRGMARAHPRIERHDHLAASKDHRARAERADRYPGLRLGVDFIETGAAAMPGVSGSGKDPLIISAGISIPLWAGSYGDAEESARHAASAHRLDREAAMRRAEGALEAIMADLRDAQRRIELYEHTLVPQADTTFQAVLGGYQTGRTTVAAVILAQRDLLELQIEHARARADHARAWTALEYIVGTELDAKEDSR